MSSLRARRGISADTRRKKVLIVDDSRVMRAWLRTVLSSDPRLEIVGEACHAVEARDFLRAQSADVITLDIEMPGMSGLEFLTRLMRARPMPVVMLSSLTAEGSHAAVQALSRGAVDCMLKPTGGYDQQLSEDICERVYQAACSRAFHRERKVPAQPDTHPVQSIQKVDRSGACPRGSLILIGASTGGVAALERVLPGLDPSGPPVVIVQHMPGNFLRSFAERLDRQLTQHVALARDGLELGRGDIVLAPADGAHTHVVRSGKVWRCIFAPNEPKALHCPSVDELFASAIGAARDVTAVILTGLGKDGAEAMKNLRAAGATTFGQDEESCVVFGMPRAALENGAVDALLPVDDISGAILESLRSPRARSVSLD